MFLEPFPVSMSFVSFVIDGDTVRAEPRLPRRTQAVRAGLPGWAIHRFSSDQHLWRETLLGVSYGKPNFFPSHCVSPEPGVVTNRNVPSGL